MTALQINLFIKDGSLSVAIDNLIKKKMIYIIILNNILIKIYYLLNSTTVDLHY